MLQVNKLLEIYTSINDAMINKINIKMEKKVCLVISAFTEVFLSCLLMAL